MASVKTQKVKRRLLADEIHINPPAGNLDPRFELDGTVEPPEAWATCVVWDGGEQVWPDADNELIDQGPDWNFFFDDIPDGDYIAVAYIAEGGTAEDTEEITVENLLHASKNARRTTKRRPASRDREAKPIRIDRTSRSARSVTVSVQKDADVEGVILVISKREPMTGKKRECHSIRLTKGTSDVTGTFRVNSLLGSYKVIALPRNGRDAVFGDV